MLVFLLYFLKKKDIQNVLRFVVPQHLEVLLSNLFDFFKYRTSQFGWKEITSVRAETSVLSYSRDNRIMTIQIQSHVLHALVGTQIHITMSPRGNKASKTPAGDLASRNLPIGDNHTGASPASLRPVEIR